MGGAFGHIPHMHECTDLTFGEIKQIINQISNASVELYEKYDGQNLMVTFKDGSLLCARNKSTLVNPMTFIELSGFFKHLDHVQVAFNDSFLRLMEFFDNFDDTTLNNFFKNGKIFLNVEIIHQVSRNVIKYEKDEVIITGAIEIDDYGNFVKHLDISELDVFTGLEYDGISIVKQINYDGLDMNEIIIELNSFMHINYLSDNNYVLEYVKKKIIEIVNTFQLTSWQKEQLINRWVRNDKSLKLSPINYGEMYSYIRDYEKNTLTQDMKRIIKPLRDIFDKMSVMLIELISSGRANENSIYDMYYNALRHVEQSNDNKLVKSIEPHIETILNMGGISKFRNIEGVVFKSPYGKLIKLTGIFAPLNQVLGVLKFSN